VRPLSSTHLSQRGPPGVRFRRQLQPVHARVENPVDSHEAPGLRTGPPADARHERVPRNEAPQLRPGLGRDLRQLGSGDDRRECPVDIEEHPGPGGIIAQPGQRILHSPQNTAVRLLVIGLIAGFFSALFGVGGGIVMVPLLLLFAHYSERPAMATSLTAVGLIALVGAVSYALHGEVKPGAAAVVGLPGAVGAVVGASLQQRLANRTLSFAFAALLAAVGVWLLI
jgi:hypothetical protein